MDEVHAMCSQAVYT